MLKFLIIILMCYVINGKLLYTPEEFDEGRVVGGQNAEDGQFPHQVSLRTNTNRHFCGGFILNENWIGTAAHCSVGQTPEGTLIVYGTLKKSSGGTKVNVSKIIVHPKYDSSNVQNDVAVWKTVEPIIFSDKIKPIVIGSEYVEGGMVAFGVGWGQTSHPGMGAEHLQWLKVKTITNQECRTRLSQFGSGTIHNTSLCTFNGVVGEGMCMGDSGGALVDASDQLIGIVSWGIPCARGMPDMFTRVSEFKDWIDNEIK